MATPQHRCVFVGNIPYDATEEQLIQICEEVGPVVSFRLVIDRDTGKPKGYGFCEYKDEETALSARRNLQGYEINGRQLRVDFAENDKNADRSREQGRGGPGMVTNVGDPQKQFGGPAMRAESVIHQPIGLPAAMTAANIMAGALGGAQTGNKMNQNGFQTQPGLGTDPLTLHLAKFSSNQLNEILSELKVLATENKEQARKLLLTFPSLCKAVFQAQMMLGVVTPQMLQMPNIRQTSGPLIQHSLNALHSRQPQVQTLPGLPLLAQSKSRLESMPKSEESEVLAGHPNPPFRNQYTVPPQLPTHSQVQLPIQSQNKFLQQGPSPPLSGVSAIPSIRPPQMINASMRPQVEVTTSSSLKQQVHPSLLQHQGQLGPPNLGHTGQLIPPHGNPQSSVLPSSSKLFGFPNYANTESVRARQVTNDSTSINEVETYQRLPLGLSEKAPMVHDNSDPSIHPSKLMKMNDGKATVSGPTPFSTLGNQIPRADEASSSANQTSQLPSEVQSALLQQVLNLTPEQISSLPPDQQQHVIELQQMMLRPG